MISFPNDYLAHITTMTIFATILDRSNCKTMRKKILLLFMMVWLSVGVNAHLQADNTGDTNYTMYVNLADGTNMQFVLSVDLPEVDYLDGKMIVYYGEHYNRVNHSEELWTYVRDHIILERNQVKDVTFAVATGIETIKADENSVAFDLSHSGTIHIRGLKGKDRIEVFSIDGRKISAPFSSQGSEAVIDLSTKPHGTYIINVNQGFTFKYMKP